MTDGIMLVAIGERYVKLAAGVCRHSRQHTDLPFYVVASKNGKGVKWPTDCEVNWVTTAQSQNRLIKTTIYDRSPFDRTLFIDCDSVIQNPGVQIMFDNWISDSDLAVNQCFYWTDKLVNLYADTMRKLDCQPPIHVYNTAMIGWRKNNRTEALFGMWHEMWKKMGSKRDMPAFCCACQKVSGLKIKITTKSFWAEGIDPKAVIQHDYDPAFYKKFGLVTMADHMYKPPTGPKDFKWTHWSKG